MLVAYTPSAKAAVADIEATIKLAVAEANQSYKNSDIKIKLYLVDSFEITYSETDKDDGTILDDFKKNADVKTRRDNSSADLAVLIMNHPRWNGLAEKIMADESTAFAIVHYAAATGNYSFAHELEHLMGARHNNDPTTAPFPYAHGYQYKGNPSWRTIMSYSRDCPGECPRLQYWSNPKVSSPSVCEFCGEGHPEGSWCCGFGFPMGTAQTNDNARVLNETATTVAAFRTHRGGSPPH